MRVGVIARVGVAMLLCAGVGVGSAQAPAESTPTYTDADLARHRERRLGGKTEPENAKPAPVRESQEQVRAQLDAEASARKAREEKWRQRATDARWAVSQAERDVKRAQAEANQLLMVVIQSCGQPIAQRQAHADAVSELETANRRLEKARQAIVDLEEQARRAAIPPGWLRE